MATHLRAFLRPDDRVPPYLGHAIKLQVNEPTQQCLAAAFLYYLLLHSTRPGGLVSEILHECLDTDLDEVRDIVLEVYQKAPHELPEAVHWANRLRDALPHTSEADPDSGPLPALNRLASHYSTHLCIASTPHYPPALLWNLGGSATPQASTHPTPDHFRLHSIQNLLDQAGNANRTSALKELVERRDRPFCPVSDKAFRPQPNGVWSELTHILPFSMHSKTITHQAIETFTRMEVDSASIIRCINQPENALLLDYNIHKSFDDDFGWGIEATTDHNLQTHYFVRVIREMATPAEMNHKLNAEIFFGAGERGDEIAKPDPRFCNLKLNVLRVLYASGAGEMLEKFWRDWDRTGLASSSLGVSQEMDELFLAKLATIRV